MTVFPSWPVFLSGHQDRWSAVDFQCARADLGEAIIWLGEILFPGFAWERVTYEIALLFSRFSLFADQRRQTRGSLRKKGRRCAGLLTVRFRLARDEIRRTALRRCNDDEHCEGTLVGRGHAAVDRADERLEWLAGHGGDGLAQPPPQHQGQWSYFLLPKSNEHIQSGNLPEIMFRPILCETPESRKVDVR